MAVHCVTRVALVLLCAALAEVGAVSGDRIEHASIIPAEMLPELRRLGITVVTQPGFVHERGDTYLDEVDAEDLSGLYRHASLLRAGIPVALSTDAPYGSANPWTTMWAASTRATERGKIVGSGERVNYPQALQGFLTPANSPGGPARRISIGARADLCLVLCRDECQPLVIATIIAGEIVYECEGEDRELV